MLVKKHRYVWWDPLLFSLRVHVDLISFCSQWPSIHFTTHWLTTNKLHLLRHQIWYLMLTSSWLLDPYVDKYLRFRWAPAVLFRRFQASQWDNRSFQYWGLFYEMKCNQRRPHQALQWPPSDTFISRRVTGHRCGFTQAPYSKFPPKTYVAW